MTLPLAGLAPSSKNGLREQIVHLSGLVVRLTSRQISANITGVRVRSLTKLSSRYVCHATRLHPKPTKAHPSKRPQAHALGAHCKLTINRKKKTMQNILGTNAIQGSPTYKGRDFRTFYANTPVFDSTTIPAGQTYHIGNGVFRSMCAGDCGTYADVWGGGYWTPELRNHEHTVHGLNVAGVNIPLIP